MKKNILPTCHKLNELYEKDQHTAEMFANDLLKEKVINILIDNVRLNFLGGSIYEYDDELIAS